jgi:hypothetical protein
MTGRSQESPKQTLIIPREKIRLVSSDKRLHVIARSRETIPKCYITQYVNYSEKYGIGYTLSNGDTGVLFNDDTSLIKGENVVYIWQEGETEMRTKFEDEVPKSMEPKY